METQQNRRVTVLGCQGGHVRVTVTELTGGPSMFFFIESSTVHSMFDYITRVNRKMYIITGVNLGERPQVSLVKKTKSKERDIECNSITRLIPLSLCSERFRTLFRPFEAFSRGQKAKNVSNVRKSLRKRLVHRLTPTLLSDFIL